MAGPTAYEKRVSGSETHNLAHNFVAGVAISMHRCVCVGLLENSAFLGVCVCVFVWFNTRKKWRIYSSHLLYIAHFPGKYKPGPPCRSKYTLHLYTHKESCLYHIACFYVLLPLYHLCILNTKRDVRGVLGRSEQERVES